MADIVVVAKSTGRVNESIGTMDASEDFPEGGTGREDIEDMYAAEAK